MDITFADPADVNEVNKTNCWNSSEITFQTIFQSAALTAGAGETISRVGNLVWVPLAITLLLGLLA